MPKIKKCPHCNQVLLCKACGVRFTPVLGGKPKLKTMVDPDTLERLREEAKREGVTINAYLKKHLGNVPPPKNSRRRAVAAEP